jgi:hypothetical protein
VALRFPFKPRLAVPVVAAMTVGVALLAFSPPAAEDAAAHDGHPDLVYDMAVNWAFSGECLSYGPLDGCNVGTGRVLQVYVSQSTDHGLTFDEVQFALEYSGVTPKGTPEVFVLSECDTRTDPDPQPAGKVVAGCTLDPAGAGAIAAAFEFTCTQTPSSGHVLTLRNGSGPEETYIQDTGGEKHSAEEPDSITVNCLDAPTAGMDLNVEGPNASCDDALDPTECDVDVGSQLTLAIETSDPPDDGYAEFATHVDYGGLLYKPAGPGGPVYCCHDEGAEAEIFWPDRDESDFRYPIYPTGSEGFIVHSAYGGQPDYAGNLVQLALTCTTAGPFVVELLAYDPPAFLQGASFFTTSGERAYLTGGDAITINCIADSPPPTPVPTPAPVGGISLYPPVDDGGTPSQSLLLALAAVPLLAAAGRIAVRLRATR